MGKGDHRSKRGKIHRGTYGRLRPKKSPKPKPQKRRGRPRPSR